MLYSIISLNKEYIKLYYKLKICPLDIEKYLTLFHNIKILRLNKNE